MNRSYEIMFIVNPTMEEADLDKLIEGFQKNVTDGGGEIRTLEKMGRRRLAYTVRKFNDGFYVLLTIGAAGSLIKELERRLRVSEPVIKFITVRMDEEEKRLAKIKAHRDTHVKRSAIPQQQPQMTGTVPVSASAAAPATELVPEPPAPVAVAAKPVAADSVAVEPVATPEPVAVEATA